MFKILNFIKSIIGKLFVIDRCFRREFNDEIGFLLEVIKTVEFDNRLTLGNGEPLSCDIVLKGDSREIGREKRKEDKYKKTIERVLV